MTKQWLTKSLVVLGIISLVTVSCGREKTPKEISEKRTYQNFQEVVEIGKNTEVNLFMWGGNEMINTYIDTFVTENVKEIYGITLNRVPMNAPDFVAKILNEKKNSVDDGSIDLLWVNAENFKALKQANALYGPFTQLLDHQNTLYDAELNDLYFDLGIPIEGYEAIWGSAQLVFSYDKDRTPNPPKSYEEFLSYAKENPEKLTYPNPLFDFVGSAFVRNAYYELVDFDFSQNISKEEFTKLSAPVISYFKELHPYLWNNGEVFPQTIAMVDGLFINKEVEMTMGFEVYKTAGEVAQGIYPETVATYLFDNGTIGNSHYLAIPYNGMEKAGAILVIDFLQSPKAQIEKMKPSVWGDMSAIDTDRLTQKEQKAIEEIKKNPAILSSKELLSKRLGDMNATYLDWIEEIWEMKIIN